MLKGSWPGVRTAAATVMIRIEIFRLARKSAAVKIPIRSRKSMMSGVWKAMPKTRGRIVAKLIHSLSRKVGATPSQTLNSSKKPRVIGNTKPKQRMTPVRKRPIEIGRYFCT